METDAVEKKQEQVENKLKENEETPPNILSFLNGVGIISAAVLGALYALTRNENSISEETIKSMEYKLKKNEEAIVSREWAYVSKLANERDVVNMKIKEADEINEFLTEMIHSEILKLPKISQEVRNTQKLIDDLNYQIQNLQAQLVKAGESNKELEEKLNEKHKFIEVLQEKLTLLGKDMKVKEGNNHDLESIVAQKDLELVNLNSTYKQIKDELTGSNSTSASLRQEISEKQKQLSEKSSMVDTLKAQVSSLIFLRDILNKKLDRARNDYDDLKVSSEEKSAMHAKFLREKELEIHQLEEMIDVKSKGLNKNQVLVSDLIRERDEMEKALDVEMNKAEFLKQELKITKELLEKSRNEVSDLEKQREL